MKFRIFAVILFAFLISGCSAQLKSHIQPDVNLSKLQSFYVVHFNSERHGIDSMISDELNRMGYKATFGEEQDMPNNVDAVVTYVDNWQWDITNYLIKLSITLRDKEKALLASGESYRTSLVRKSPPDMVKEVLHDMFDYKGQN